MNLVSALLAAATTTPDRPALRSPGGVVSFGELAGRAGRAAALLAQHVRPGDRVALVADNEEAFVTAYLGTLAAGAVVVPLNSAAPSHELSREFAVVEPALVIASAGYADLVKRATARHTPAVPMLVMDPAVTDAPAPIAPVSRAADDLAVLLFTAGTAGPPKAAMLTHGSLLANLEQMQGHPGLRINPDDVALAVLPWFHVFGLNVVLNLSLLAGASCSLVQHFHPVETLECIASDDVTVLAVVPAVLAAWVAQEDAAPDAFGTVRLVVSGAAALPGDTAEAFEQRFGKVVHQGYGLTEASPVVSTSAVAERPRPDSIGPPLPGVEVRLVDADGHDVLEGDAGEILVRGANVFAGYWRDEEATKQVLVDGWLHTGDIAVADADGWLTLVERAKDVIIVSGFNVYPGEVEEAIVSHAEVEDVAVIGEPHPRTGETVVAFVVAKPGTEPDPVELLRHAGRRLARYKLPTRVDVVSELPRSFSGKLLRRALSSSGGGDGGGPGNSPAVNR